MINAAGVTGIASNLKYFSLKRFVQKTKYQYQAILKNEAIYGVILWAFLTFILSEVYLWKIGW